MHINQSHYQDVRNSFQTSERSRADFKAEIIIINNTIIIVAIHKGGKLQMELFFSLFLQLVGALLLSCCRKTRSGN